MLVLSPVDPLHGWTTSFKPVWFMLSKTDVKHAGDFHTPPISGPELSGLHAPISI